MKVLVTGAGGMVGSAALRHLLSQGDEALAYEHSRLDISDEAAVRRVFDTERPEAVINCAAWTDVDGCERDEARAVAINALGPENLARNSRRHGALLLTISTDFIFDGEKEGFYTQRDDPNPQSVYARSKLEGERRAVAASARSIVVRTGFIFGAGGRNFLSQVIERAHRGERLMAIADATGTPTFAPDLAARMCELLRRDLPGIFHVVNGGAGASYDEFARAALRLAGLTKSAEVESVSMSSLQRPAKRPRNSRLRCLLSEAIGLEPLRHWQEALADFVYGQRAANGTQSPFK